MYEFILTSRSTSRYFLHSRFLPHSFYSHRQGILDILQCEPTRESVQRAMLQWNAVEFETEAASRKMCATALRSFGDWDKHPQGLALANTPPVTIAKIGDAPKRVVDGRKLDHPLQDIRVLDLSRVLAGPICGRTLASMSSPPIKLSSTCLLKLWISARRRRFAHNLTKFAESNLRRGYIPRKAHYTTRSQSSQG